MPTQMVKNEWNDTSTSLYIFMACCLIKHRDNLCMVLLNVPSSFFYSILYLQLRDTRYGIACGSRVSTGASCL
jgi:hypothetical protein